MVLEQRIKDTLNQTKKRVEELGKRAEGSLADIKAKARSSMADVPVQLRGAWGLTVEAMRRSLDLPTSEDFKRLTTRVEELAHRVDHLARERMAQASAKVAAHMGKRDRAPGKTHGGTHRE